MLHLDGDSDYLKKCLNLYKRLSVPVVGVHLREAEMAASVGSLLAKVTPDILILTGHDGLIKRQGSVHSLANYRHSAHYAEAVKAARRYEKHLDGLVIFAGGCQSHFEALLEAGANFASSPGRIMIHTYDPVFVAQMIAYTPIGETVDVMEVAKRTITGIEGIGGLETRGGYRRGMPHSLENESPQIMEKSD